MSDDDFIEESDVDPEAVKAFIEAGEKLVEDAPKAAQDLLSGAPTDTEEAKNIEKQEDFNVSLSTDMTFDENHRSAIDSMFVAVKDVDIEVTDDDKVNYLKATLNNVPVRLRVDMENGLSFICRSLSVYEGDLVFDAVTQNIKNNPDTAPGLLEGFMQQYRASMQVVSINGRALDSISFEYEEGKRAEHAAQLLAFSNAQLMNTQSTLFFMIVRALNVFQHKITRLQEAAFNKDFWSPVSID